MFMGDGLGGQGGKQEQASRKEDGKMLEEEEDLGGT